jgi:hypothetical protein
MAIIYAMSVVVVVQTIIKQSQWIMRGMRDTVNG